MKRLLVLVLLIVSVCIGSLMAVKSQEQKTKTKTERQRERKEQRGGYARQVYRGLMDPGRDKIPDVVATWDRDMNFTTENGLPSLIPFAAPPTLQQILNDRACYVDAIVLGVVKAQTSRLTEDETFIYTINELAVTTVLKDNEAQQIKPGEQINVLRTGGTIQLNGRKVTALYRAYAWLQMDHTYLLYLSYVPEKGVYVADSITYELRNDNTFVPTEDPLDQSMPKVHNSTSFISLIHSAVAAPCDD